MYQNLISLNICILIPVYVLFFSIGCVLCINPMQPISPINNHNKLIYLSDIGNLLYTSSPNNLTFSSPTC